MLPALSTQQCHPERKGIATGRSADLRNAGRVTQGGEILRSEPDWRSAQDDTDVTSFATETRSNAKQIHAGNETAPLALKMRSLS